MSRGRDYLGSYRLTRLIRAAQTTQVWEAENEADSKKYALKILQPNFKKNAEELGFLKHEYEVAHPFRHPNVIRIYELNLKSELPFIVMELFENPNMKIALRQGTQNFAKIAHKVIEQSAEGLFYVHEQGWIHRDIKPDNILVSPEGETRVIDFSIAEKPKSSFLKLFGKGKIQGTRSYMSPEQIKGHTLDPRADVYSFGCVLFEILAGKAPYTGSTPDELLEKHLKAQVPTVMTITQDIMPEMAALIQRMMQKDRNSRPASMWEVLKELRQIKIFKPKIGRPPPTKEQSPTIMSQATEVAAPGLAFEQPIYDLEGRIRELEQTAGKTAEAEDELRQLRRELADLTRQIYSNLTPWESVQIARHKNRPYTADYLNLAFEEFVELHGDRRFGDDRAIVSGFAKLDQYKVMVIGHQKGRTYKERSACYFGCAHPEGYRKALLKMQMAAKYGLPVICFIDTPGAYPGVGAEERGQSQAIAENMFEMSRLNTPVICVVIGEGGSGGALGIGVGDRVAILEHAYYSVISPEGCAGILWKSGTPANSEKAAKALRFTGKDLLQFGVVDHILDEPLGGAHRDHHRMAARLKMYLIRTLRELLSQPREKLLEDRYQRFRKLGVYLDGSQPVAAT